jgi:hypothetical protein
MWIAGPQLTEASPVALGRPWQTHCRGRHFSCAGFLFELYTDSLAHITHCEFCIP